MPDYNLGKAHGKIVIDTDKRGANDANKSLDSLNATAQKLERVMNRLERTLTNIEHDLQKVAASAKVADRALDDLDGANIRVTKSTHTASRSVRDFDADLGRVISTIQRVTPALWKMYGAIDHVISHFQQFGAASKFIDHARITRSFLLIDRAVWGLTKRVIGYNKALSLASDRQRSFINRAGKLAVAVGGISMGLRTLNMAYSKSADRAGKLFKVTEKLANGYYKLYNTAAHGSGRIGTVSRVLNRAMVVMSGTTEASWKLSRSFNQIGQGATRMIGGFLLAKHAMGKLAQQFSFLSKMNLHSRMIFGAVVAGMGLVRPAAEILAKTLTMLSNGLKFTFTAGKELAGGLLILPGLYATVAAAILPMVLGLKGLADAFKGVGGTDEEFAEALEAMPEHLKGVAKAIRPVIQEWKKLKEAFQVNFFQGIDKDIETLSANYMPQVKKMFGTMAASYNNFRTKLVQSLSKDSALTDFNLSFSAVFGTMANLARALDPFLTGLRNITVVGMQFVRDFSLGAVTISQRLADWSTKARANGSLRWYMDQALIGVKNLIRGTKDLAQGLWTILTAFSTKSGNNALDTFAKSMEKFNAAIDKSKASGFLRSFSDAVKNMGFDSLKRLGDMIKSMYEPLKQLVSAISEFMVGFSHGFKTTLIPALKVATQLVEMFVQAFEPIAPIIGMIAGLVVGFKAISFAAAPIIRLTQAFIGLAVAAKGFKAIFNSKLWNGAGLLFDSLAGGSGKVLGIFDKIERGAGKVGRSLLTMGRFAGAAGAIIATAAFFINGAQQDIDSWNKILDESARRTQAWKESLRDAFSADLGLSGKSVFSEMTQGMDDMMADLDAKSSNRIGWWENLKALWGGGGDQGDSLRSGWGPLSTAQGQEFNNMQKATQDARRAQEKFKELGLTNKELAKYVTGSEEAFKKFSDEVIGSGENSNEAKAALQQYRDEFNQMQADFAEIGPNGVALSRAIEGIADAGADATSKLQALKAALRALGLDKGDEIEGAFAYSRALKAIGEEANRLVDSSASLENLFNADGTLNTLTGGQNAENLFTNLRTAVQEFQQEAVNTGDATEPYNRLLETIPKLAAAFQQSEENVLGLAQQLGAVPDTVEVLLAVSGGDEATANLAQILAKFENENSAEIKIDFIGDKEGMQKILDDVLGAGKGYTTDNMAVIARDNITDEAIQEIRRRINEKLKENAEKNPLEVPVKPKLDEGNKPKAGEPQKENAPPQKPAQVAPSKPAEPQQPAEIPAPDTTKLDEANGKLDQVKAKLQEIDLLDPQIDFKTENVDAALEKISGFKTKFDEIKNSLSEGKLEFTIIAKGYDETVAVLGRVKDAVDKVEDATQKIAPSFQTAFTAAQTHVNTFISGVTSSMSGLAGLANGWGSSIGANFAAGLASQVGAVTTAAQSLAKAVTDNTKPGSPTKKGPLSGSGWVGYSGKKIAQSFAGGISEGTPAVDAAAGRMAGGVASAAQGPFDLGKMLGGVNDFIGIASKIAEMFGNIADQILNVAKFMSDPLGEGKFFGQKLYGRDKNVSDRDLQRKREDELQSKLASAVTSGAKDEQKEAEKAARDTEKTTKRTQKATEQVAENTDQRKSAKTIAQEIADQPRPTDLAENIAKTLSDRKIPEADASTGSKSPDVAILDKSAPENAPLYKQGPDLSNLTSDELKEIQNNTSLTVASQEDMIRELRSSNPKLDEAIRTIKDGNAANEDIYKALPVIDSAIEEQTKKDTASGRATASALESMRGDVMSQRGIAEQDPIGDAQQIAGQAASFAQEVFATIQSVMESIGAAKEIGDMMVRGVENSEDVMKLIDNFQQFLTTAAQIASTVASGLNMASSMAGAGGGADPSGGSAGASAALGAASQIASFISAGITTVNGIIDLSQEIYRTVGKYFGEFLGFLTGGMDGQLMGDVKFLLDETDGTLKTWSKDNPEDKRIHDNPFTQGGTVQQAPKVGEINIFPERGTDPAEMTNQMMFAVSAASSGAWSD